MNLSHTQNLVVCLRLNRKIKNDIVVMMYWSDDKIEKSKFAMDRNSYIMIFFYKLINSELASLQERLEDTMQKNTELDQHLVNRKMVIREQVPLNHVILL